MERARALSIIIVAAALILATTAARHSPASSKDCRYFDETGHYVCGQFLDFFDARGGLEIFGYPLTEAFDDPTHSGLRVQYFQRARMESHPGNSEPYKVQLGLLVDELGYSFPPARAEQIPPSNSALHHYFPETDHVVSYAFLEYFRDEGGLDIFGYPRSEFVYENGRIVQYFQRARMEWHPERARDSQISLSNLGETYLERFGIPGNYDEPLPPSRGAEPPAIPASSDDCRYFDETGHHVCGPFLHFFGAKGGLEIFGFPLTEEFSDRARDGLRVQYFQRTRMERPPHSSALGDVQLGLLVEELGHSYPPVRPEQVPASESTAHLYFPETQHVVSHVFLEYFRDNGGLEIFGYPLSEFMVENGRIVQYFQRARLEWHPDRRPGSQITLSNVGEIYLEEFGTPGDNDQPLPPARPAEPSVTPTPFVIELHTDASVRSAITGREGNQTVFVYVSDQQDRPVQGADVTAVVHYQSGDQSCEFAPTDASGFAGCSFEVPPSPPGKRVVIDVTVTYANLRETTQTSFLPWW